MSPILIENGLAAITNYKIEAGNFQVRASKVSREVTATYEKDEMSLAGTLASPCSSQHCRLITF